MSMAEWDRTGLAEQRMLREGLEAEAPWIGRTVMLNKAEDPLSAKSGVFADQLDDEADEGSAEDLSSLGMQVRVSQKLTPVYRSAGTD